MHYRIVRHLLLKGHQRRKGFSMASDKEMFILAGRKLPSIY